MCAAQSDKDHSGSAELRRAQMIVSFQQGMSSDAQGRVAKMSISSSQDERLVPTVRAKEKHL